LDGLYEGSDAPERAPANSFPCDFGKPAFYLVEPGSAGGREVQVVTGVPLEPRADSGMLVGAVVVQDQMNGKPSGHAAVDPLQEADELLVPMTWLTLRCDLPT